MINEDYISFETAKLLKEKGFDEKCIATYNLVTGTFEVEEVYQDWTTRWKAYVSAPTLQMAMKWLREVHLLNISIFSYPKDYDKYVHGWSFFIHKLSFEDERWNWDDSVHAAIDKKSSDDKIYETYEEACDAAIRHCLKNLI